MRKLTALLTMLIMLLFLVACGTPTSEPVGSQTPASTLNTAQPTASEQYEAVAFTDPVLEAMVRGAMGKTDGAITAEEAAAVTRLDLSASWERFASEWTPVKNLGGLEFFTGLESLDLSDHAITDVMPLASLTKLTTLALGGNPIADIAPLAGLTSLKALILTGCEARDYSTLADLTELEYLRLDNSAIEDAAPLASLTNLKQLYLKGCKLSYSPLAEIYPNLKDKDFTIATTLAEYGFYMDGAQAVYDAEQVSVRINHIEWGTPMTMGAENCVRTVSGTDEYKLDIGYYPEHEAYVVQVYMNGEFVVNYVYSLADGGVNLSAEDRERYETHLREIFPDAQGEDLLLEPVSYYNAALKDALNMTADELYELPFQPLTLAQLGFSLGEESAAYEYHEHEPHDMHVSIYDPKTGNGPDNCSAEFYDDNVGGYSLLVQYFSDKGYYHVALFKDGQDCAYNMESDNDEYSLEYPDAETVDSMLSSAFGTQEDEMYAEPLVHLKKFLITRFNMSIDELCALPKG